MDEPLVAFTTPPLTCSRCKQPMQEVLAFDRTRRWCETCALELDRARRPEKRRLLRWVRPWWNKD